MVNSTYVWLLLVVSMVLANLPWLTSRLFVVFPLKAEKTIWWRLLELVLYMAMSGVLGFVVEAQQMGVTHHQDWEFYAVGSLLFVVFAIPGFIYKYQFQQSFMR